MKTKSLLTLSYKLLLDVCKLTCFPLVASFYLPGNAEGKDSQDGQRLYLKTMKIINLFFLGFLFLIFGSAQVAYADDISDLKRQIKKIQEKIEAIEAKEKSSLANETRVPSDNRETRFQALEDEIKYIGENQDSLMKRLEQRINLNLYVTLEYENFENSASIFDAKNIELILSSQITSRLKSFAEIEFERVAKTSSGSRQGEVEVEQGWIEYSINGYFNPRFGVILVPFGRFNQEHFNPWRDLTDRPIAMGRVVPTAWAEAGAGFVGDAHLGKFFSNTPLRHTEVNYQVFFINGLTNEFSDKGTRDARGSFGTDNNNNKAVVGRLGIAPLPDYEIGLSGYYGAYDESGRDIIGFDVDWKFVLGPLELIGEYAYFDVEKGGFQKDSATLTVPENLQGGYAQANYHFWFDSLNNTFLGKSFSNPTFTAVIRYGWANIDDDNDPGLGANKENRLTLGFNYRPVEALAFKFEYQINDTKKEALERGDNNGFLFSVSGAF